MIELEIRAVKIVEEFLKDELEDYSSFKPWKIITTECENDKVYVSVDLPKQSIDFKVIFGKRDNCLFSYPEPLSPNNDHTLYICMYEDVYEEINTYSWRVKYFWQVVDWNV